MDAKKKKPGRPKNKIIVDTIKSPFVPDRKIYRNLEKKTANFEIDGNDLFYSLSRVSNEKFFLEFIKESKADLLEMRKRVLQLGRSKKHLRRYSIWKSVAIKGYLKSLEAWIFHLPKNSGEERDRSILLSIFAFEMGMYSMLTLHDYPNANEGARNELLRKKSALKTRISPKLKREIIADYINYKETGEFKSKTAILDSLSKNYRVNEKTIRNFLKKEGIE